MPRNWSIEAKWESLETGSPEERAGFAALGISVYGNWLTEGLDKLLQSVRQAPLLSSYHLAEWLAWNWWRLRWEPEPRKASSAWGLSHRLASIGGGYIWPNIYIASDGRYVEIVSKPTHDRVSTPFRYISDSNNLITASDFETEIDNFIDQVLQRLDDKRIKKSNLETVWKAVLEERHTPETARLRKLEALLGEDPDELDEALLRGLIHDSDRVGLAAIEEIAANRSLGQKLPSASELLQIGRKEGHDTSLTAGVVFSGNALVAEPSESFAAWQLGTSAAQALREQEGLDCSPIDNQALADMFGTSVKALESPSGSMPNIGISFDVTEATSHGHVVLRSKWPSGRRFELARLLGDRLISAIDEPVRPATRAYTYRQKVQRAFAAELLSPFREVEAMLEGDYSMEMQQDVAHHFQVSGLTIRTLLVNHNRIDRSNLDWELAGMRSG